MEEIIMNNETIEQVAEQAMEQAVEIAATPRVSWSKFGIGILKAGAAIGGVVLVIKGVKYVVSKINEKKQGEETDTAVDNVEVAKHDFLENDPE